MKNGRLLRSLAILGILGTGFAASPVDEIRIERSRPLGALAAELRNRYGYLVTYEDAPADARDIIHERRVNGTEYRYPAWKPMVFHVQARVADAEAVAASPGSAPARVKPLGPDVIDPLVAEYNSSGNVGKFTVIYDGDYAHVVPAGRTVGGQTVDFEPILSTVVPSTQDKGSCSELLSGLLSEVQEIRGVKISVVTVPVQPMETKQCSVAGHWLPAREVLIQLLDGMGDRPFSTRVRSAWGLMYDPTTEAYFLDARLVWGYPPNTGSPAPAAPAQPRQEVARAGAPPSARSSLPKAFAPASADASGTVVVQTNPSGGIFVDDQFYGMTPRMLILKPGKHTIRVKASGYKDWVTEVSTGTRTQSRLNATLEKLN